MGRTVFDASVLVKFVVSERASEAAARAYAAATEPIAPAWGLLETAHALWRKFDRGEHDAAEVTTAFAAIRTIGLGWLPDDDLAEAALAIALELRHPVCDCAYLALALQEDAALATADARLRTLAEEAGIEVVWVGDASGG